MHQIDGHSHSHEHDKSETPLIKKIIGTVVSLLIVATFWYQLMPKSVFEKGFIVGEIVELQGVKVTENDLFSEQVEVVQVKLKNGEVVQADYVTVSESASDSQFVVGDKVVVNYIDNVVDGNAYQIVDFYRLNVLIFLLVFLVVVACIFSGWNAIYSFIGLAFSVLVLIFVIVKGILNGWNPLLITIFGAFLISTVSVYLGHGFKRQTNIAVAGIIFTLGIVGVLSVIFVNLGHLVGMGSEEAFFLQLDSGNSINLQGIFLAGIIIGTLGVLDDITTSQVAVVDQLHKANTDLNSNELYFRAVTVGKEHITALINTLVLAYAGASMPLFILFIQGGIQPVWGLLNGQFVAEEIVRTLLGSIALILSVPITTLLAAKFLHKKSPKG